MSAKIVCCTAALVVLAASAANALASPGAGSIASRDGSWIYMVSPQSGDSTIVTKIRGSDRTAQVKQRLDGSFEVPAVAGVKGGLAHDGSTLVLGGHPSSHVSQFAVLDARTLRVQRVLSLHGTYSFDALSPDASTLYVIRFLSQDGSHYAVQGLDLTARRPVAKTLVEKGEPGEAMSGQALTRTTSPDGAWVYTLYDGEHGAPFVHALSTVDAITVCIDLDALAGRADLASLRLAVKPDGHQVAVRGATGTLAVIDTDSFEVTTPATPAPPAPTAKKAENSNEPNDGRTTLWWLLAGAAGLVAAGAVARTKHLQKSQTPRQI